MQSKQKEETNKEKSKKSMKQKIENTTQKMNETKN
jgi:hypothetical protein